MDRNSASRGAEPEDKSPAATDAETAHYYGIARDAKAARGPWVGRDTGAVRSAEAGQSSPFGHDPSLGQGSGTPSGNDTQPKPYAPRGGMRGVITGDIIYSKNVRRWYPLALWCCLLIFVYIAQHFNYQRLQRLEIQKGMELNEERSRSVVFSSLRMNASRHSRIVEEVKRRGLRLEEPQAPPKIVK